MDLEWIKTVSEQFATHGPWALFCLFLAWNYMKDVRAGHEVQTKLAEALAKLTVVVEALRHHRTEGQQ